MRCRFLVLALLAGLMFSNTGCLINMWSSNPNRRMKQLLVWSENLRQIQNEWDRIWFNDMPSTLTYEHVHGGLTP